MTLRIATRRSPLALLQAEFVQGLFRVHDVDTELVTMHTSGDRALDAPLSSLGGQGVFAIEVQRAVIEGRADVAVHSAKDLPSVTLDGLVLASVPERRDPLDVLVGRSLAGLGPGATVATGSPRRRALLLERRPDLRIVELRGNMATRLSMPGTNGIDAVVAAAAALERLGESALCAERLDPSWFVPQVGQGALALEARVDDAATLSLLAMINDVGAMTALLAERAFLRELGTGCSIPAGAHATLRDAEVLLHGVMIGVDGSKSVRASLSGPEPESLGAQLAMMLRDDMGGATLVGWDATS
ncbi:MAG: hydroxymethylbilane synthase [Acidobacteria bacterium]|nr:hydroxymethylbilane synthase [Acidobacteriota bacterium]